MKKLLLFFAFITVALAEYEPSLGCREWQGWNSSNSRIWVEGSTCQYSEHDTFDYNNQRFNVTRVEGMSDGAGHSGTTHCQYLAKASRLSSQLTCPINEVLDEEFCTCSIPEPTCPSNATYSNEEETCVCNVPYASEYQLNGSLSCVEPTCPSTYEISNNILPLYLQTSVSVGCNAFPLSDSASFSVGDILCCYGQEDIEDDNKCPPNHIKLGDKCIKITHSDNNSTPPLDHDCPPQHYWSIISEQCEPFFPDDNNSDNSSTPPHDTGIPNSNPSDFGQNDLDEIDGNFGLSDYLEGDGTGSEYGINLDGVGSSISSVLDSYVLLPLPVSARGSCSEDLSASFTVPVINKTLTLDASPYMATFFTYAEVIKYIIYFVSALGAITLLLIGGF